MKLDWKPNRVAFLDFETQSMEPLTTTHKYASHPSTRALTCCVKVGGQMHRFGPYLDADAKQKLANIAAENVLAAHNAPFDAAIWELTEKLPEATWFDTLPPARAGGYPGRLDKLSLALGGRGKDKNGKRLIDMLCIIRNKVPVVGPAHKLLMDYNVQDVEELEFIYSKVAPFVEPDVMTVDRIINDRGVPLDRSLIHRMIELYDKNADKLGKEFAESSGGVNPKSPKQMVEYLKRMGFNVSSVNKTVMKDLLSDPGRFFAGDSELDAAYESMRDAMEMRRELVRVGKGKAEAALEGIEHDDRIRDQFVYWGAGPGRWAGRKLQLHNMPLSVKWIDAQAVEPTYEAVCAEAQRASELAAAETGSRVKVANADVLNAMLRSIVRAENLLVADYAAVEARCLAWIAGCTKMTELFRDPKRSVYLDMGKALFGRPISKDDKQEYALSKAIVLGCGYGMSGAKFNLTCKSRGTNVATLESMGMTPQEAVKVYRTTYPEIPALWRELDVAVKSAVDGTPAEAGRCQFERVGEDLHIVLPSSRRIVYRNVRVEMLIPGYCKLYGMPEIPVPTIVYDKPRGVKTGFLYGSKTCENICQGICRDFIAVKLVELEQDGFHPICHVHDEAMTEDPASKLDRFMEVFSTPPAWADGFPLMAEGYSGPVWTKQIKRGKEFKPGYRGLDAMLGRPL